MRPFCVFLLFLAGCSNQLTAPTETAQRKSKTYDITKAADRHAALGHTQAEVMAMFGEPDHRLICPSKCNFHGAMGEHEWSWVSNGAYAVFEGDKCVMFEVPWPTNQR